MSGRVDGDREPTADEERVRRLLAALGDEPLPRAVGQRLDARLRDAAAADVVTPPRRHRRPRLRLAFAAPAILTLLVVALVAALGDTAPPSASEVGAAGGAAVPELSPATPPGTTEEAGGESAAGGGGAGGLGQMEDAGTGTTGTEGDDAAATPETVLERASREAVRAVSELVRERRRGGP